MQQDPGNYGRAREPGDTGDETGHGPGYDPGYGPEHGAGLGRSTTMSPEDERTWSMLSHLSVLAALIGLMPLGALIVWLVYKDRSPRVGFHALQALWYQIAWLVILVVGWFVTMVLTFVLIGFLLIPVMVVASIVPVVHGCYAAYKVYNGEDYRYPYIADRIDARRAA